MLLYLAQYIKVSLNSLASLLILHRPIQIVSQHYFVEQPIKFVLLNVVK
jgi:hypothetical protein